MKFINKNKKIIIVILYFIIFVLFVIRPINFDTKIYLDAAYRADLMDSFPKNILETYEHKMLLNRLIFFFIAKIAKIFVNPDRIIAFEAVVKLVYGLISVLVIGVFTKKTKNFFEKYHINENVVFTSLYLVIFFNSIYYSMQTEITGLVILLIAIMFILKEKAIFKIIGAFFISLLFFLKGVTLLYSVLILLIMILEKQKIKDIIFTILMSINFLVIELAGIYIICPEQFIETYLSMNYITDTWDKQGIVIYLLNNLTMSIYTFIGIISFIFNIICHKKLNNKKVFIIEILTWTMLFIGVAIQKFAYYYQMSLIIPACLMSFYISIYYIKTKKVEINNTLKLIIGIIIVLNTIIMIEATTAIELDIYVTNMKNEYAVQNLIQENPDIRDEEVLYIGNGISSYYIKAKAYLKHTTTIFLGNDNSIYMNNEYVDNIKKKIKEYKGKYVIIDNIELKTKKRISDDIIEYINENYIPLKSTEIGIYETLEKKEYSMIYVKK